MSIDVFERDEAERQAVRQRIGPSDFSLRDRDRVCRANKIRTQRAHGLHHSIRSATGSTPISTNGHSTPSSIATRHGGCPNHDRPPAALDRRPHPMRRARTHATTPAISGADQNAPPQAGRGRARAHAHARGLGHAATHRQAKARPSEAASGPSRASLAPARATEACSGRSGGPHHALDHQASPVGLRGTPRATPLTTATDARNHDHNRSL